MEFNFNECIKRGVEQAMRECELTIGMTLKEAVEKQVPKKPIKRVKYYKNGADGFCIVYCCPVCKYKLIHEDREGFFAGRKQKYCDCGQALDWSETND